MATDSDIQDLREAAGETIYLVPMSIDGGLRYAWCDDPAPEEGMDASEAVEYVRRDKCDALAAHVERLDIHAKSCAIELAAMIDRYNTQNMEDGSWEYDHQTPHDLMMALRDSPETSLARLKAQWKAEALEWASGAFIVEQGDFAFERAEVSEWLSETADELRRQSREPDQ